MPYLQLGYKRLFYTDTSPSSSSAPPRETFIFQHGLGSAHTYYSATVARLLTENFRCITFDTTGAGRSSYTFVEQSIESLAEDVIGILDALQVQKAVFVGHSMGGIVGAHLAAKYGPSRIVAAVLIGPVYPSPAVGDVFGQRIQVVEEKGVEEMAEVVPANALAQGASPLSRAFVRELILGQDKFGYLSNCRIIQRAVPPDYKGVKIPILVIAGREDKSAPLEGCERIIKELGTEEKRLVVLEGVGHWHCVEDPEKVAENILEFYHEIQ